MGDNDKASHTAPTQPRSGVCAETNAMRSALERHAIERIEPKATGTAIAAAAEFSAVGVLGATRDLAPGSAAPALARRLRAQLARSQASEWTRTNAGERSDAERG